MLKLRQYVRNGRADEVRIFAMGIKTGKGETVRE